MSKKGFLLAEETLKIIIAIIAIGFLVYFLVSLYLSAKTSAESEQAKATLPFIINAINQSSSSVDIYNPKGWIIGIWPHAVTSGFGPFQSTQIENPKTCNNIGLQTCICICSSDSADSCNSNGVCADNMGFSIQGTSITINNPPTTLIIDKTTKTISKK
ncbi:MAG: hypothetical protein ABSG05_02315 [Candidatus Pacearchaeota archaeon]|jgi:hypothetical protein